MPALHYQFSDMVVASSDALPELPSATVDPAEVVVEWHPIDALERRPVFSSWNTPSDRVWLTFADARDGYLLTFGDVCQFHVSTDAARVQVRPLATTAPATARHLLINQVLPLVLSRRGRLVLHASAISYRGSVVAFVGRSGSGKSTLAAACATAGASVVTDDCLVLRPVGGEWHAVPCDAGIRLWPQSLQLLDWPPASGTGLAHFSHKRRIGAGHESLTFERAVLPLRQVYRMVWPIPESVFGVLRGRAAVMALASELFRLDLRDAAETRWQFDQVSDLASAVPVEAPVRQAPFEAAAAVLCRM